MMTIIEEAVMAFETRHNDRCLANCNCSDLIKRIKDYEKSITKNVAQDVAQDLDNLREDWLNVADLKPGYFAEYLNRIFDVAIEFCNDHK